MSRPELTSAGLHGPATPSLRPSLALAAAGTGARSAQAAAQVARPAAEQACTPRVIDGEITGSWFPRPMLPMLAGSGAMFAMGLAALVQEAFR